MMISSLAPSRILILRLAFALALTLWSAAAIEPLRGQTARRPTPPVDSSRPPGCATLPWHTFAYDPRAPLALTDSLLSVRDGVETHQVTFAAPDGARANGLLFVPTSTSRPGPLPGIVMQHGMPGSTRTVERVSGNLASHGAVVLAIDAPFVARAGPPVRFTPDDSAEQVRLVRNLRRAFDLLSVRRDVDSTRLAFVGRSYGGAIGALLAAVEHRPKVFVLIVADGGLVEHLAASDALSALPRAQRERWLAAMQPIEPRRYIGCALGALYFQSALRDRMVSPENARALHSAAPEPKRVQWYDLDHNLGLPSLIDELKWLHEAVGTASPRPVDQFW